MAFKGSEIVDTVEITGKTFLRHRVLVDGGKVGAKGVSWLVDPSSGTPDEGRANALQRISAWLSCVPGDIELSAPVQAAGE